MSCPHKNRSRHYRGAQLLNFQKSQRNELLLYNGRSKKRSCCRHESGRGPSAYYAAKVGHAHMEGAGIGLQSVCMRVGPSIVEQQQQQRAALGDYPCGEGGLVRRRQA